MERPSTEPATDPGRETTPRPQRRRPPRRSGCPPYRLYDEAIVEYRRLHRRVGGLAPAGLAATYARMGRTEDAREILRAWEARADRTGRSGIDVARIHAALGDVDEAFRWLERAHEIRPYLLFLLGADPAFDPLRADPRFDEMLGRIGLPLRP